LVRVTFCDVATDQVLRGSMIGARFLARARIAASNSFKDQAARSAGIGHVAAGGIFQDRDQRFSRRSIGAQQLRKRDGAGLRVAFKDAFVEAGFTSKGGVEARRIDADRLSDIGDAHRVVASRMEQLLGDVDSFIRIETPRSSTRTFICSYHYETP